MADEGATVTDIGVVTTPMSYFASGFYGFPATVMVTASHNPSRYNGFKVCREKAMALSEATGLREIERLAEQIRPAHCKEFKSSKASATRKGPCGKGGSASGGQESKGVSVKTLDIRADYKKFILGMLKVNRPLKVAVDTANGAVGPIFDYIFKQAGFNYMPLYFEPDGRFPNHEPNPMDEGNLAELKKAVIKEKADFGVAFDGDGDRCIFLDERAERIPSDLVTALIAREMIAPEPGAGIVYDLRSSRVVREEIVKAGGKPLRERVGHAFIKDTMRRNNAPFGGELSGHYYFRENYFADSGIIAFIHYINAISRDSRPVSEVLKPFRRYFASGELNFEVADKEAKVAEIARQFADGKQDKLDGITVEYADWWFNVRPSNTEPLLRLNIEAQTAEQLEKVKNKLIAVLGNR